ncbi:hypothetical protein Dimus_009967 [Dionaea muscipula]
MCGWMFCFSDFGDGCFVTIHSGSGGCFCLFFDGLDTSDCLLCDSCEMKGRVHGCLEVVRLLERYYMGLRSLVVFSGHMFMSMAVIFSLLRVLSLHMAGFQLVDIERLCVLGCFKF